MKLDNLSYPWAEEKRSLKRLRMKANRPFLFMHHPQNWELVHIEKIDKKKKTEKPILVPKFSVLKLTAGVNLVRPSGKGVQSNIAISNAQKEGFTIIDPEVHDYITVYPAIRGKFYCDKWTAYEQVGVSLINSFDKVGYDEFRKNLVRDGHIKVPHIHFIRVLLNENSRIISKYSQSQHNPNHQVIYNKAVRYQEDLKVFMKELNEQGVAYYD